MWTVWLERLHQGNHLFPFALMILFWYNQITLIALWYSRQTLVCLRVPKPRNCPPRLWMSLKRKINLRSCPWSPIQSTLNELTSIPEYKIKPTSTLTGKYNNPNTNPRSLIGPAQRVMLKLNSPLSHKIIQRRLVPARLRIGLPEGLVLSRLQ